MIARILGPRGELISSLKAELGASQLALCGDGLGKREEMSSTRVHFIGRGPRYAVTRLESVLERFLAEVHEVIAGKIEVERGGGAISVG